MLLCKLTVVGYLAWSTLAPNRTMWLEMNGSSASRPLVGMWDVKEVAHALPPESAPGAELRVVARRRDPERFMIRGRGFRWVQPYPFWDRQ